MAGLGPLLCPASCGQTHGLAARGQAAPNRLAEDLAADPGAKDGKVSPLFFSDRPHGVHPHPPFQQGLAQGSQFYTGWFFPSSIYEILA